MATEYTRAELRKERLKRGMNQSQFADFLGINRSQYSRMENGGPISETMSGRIRKALEKPFDIDKLKQGKKKQGGGKTFILGEKNTPYNILEDEEVNFSTEDIKKGMISYYSFERMPTSTPTARFNVPGFEDCTTAYIIAGEGMNRVIPSGAILLCKPITDLTLIPWGEVFFVVTYDWKRACRLQETDDNAIALAVPDSDQVHHKPQKLPLDKILELYLVRGHIDRLI